MDHRSLGRTGVSVSKLWLGATMFGGPRTMQQFKGQLAGADVELDQAVLDRIDEAVAPGTTINPVDDSFSNPALEPAARRR